MPEEDDEEPQQQQQQQQQPSTVKPQQDLDKKKKKKKVKSVTVVCLLPLCPSSLSPFDCVFLSCESFVTSIHSLYDNEHEKTAL